MKVLHRRSKQSGDTIVEVLVAIAIVSAVLTGAFIVTQKSAQAVRGSQEHAEMAQILQGQVEAIRALALTSTDDVSGVFANGAGSSQYFCIGTNASSALEFNKRIDSSAQSLTDIANYNTGCKNIQKLYNIAIRYDPATHVFYFNGTWDKLGGGSNSVQFSYKVYPGLKVYSAVDITTSKQS